MRIANASDKACKRDVGALANTLIIKQGGTNFWSSDDCNPGGNAQVQTLQPGQSYSVSVVWRGYASQPGCPTNVAAGAAGSYSLTGRNGKVDSAPSAFTLT